VELYLHAPLVLPSVCLGTGVLLSSLYWLTGVGGIVKKEAGNVRFMKNGVDSYACA